MKQKVTERLAETPHRTSTALTATGHSLGGALALLASHAIQEVHHLDNLACYTFGAPRPGNKAFAHSYERLVPDTWNVINDR